MKIKHYDQELGRWVIDGASNANDIELTNPSFLDENGTPISTNHGFTKVANDLKRLEDNLAWIYVNGALGGGGGGGGPLEGTITIDVIGGNTIYTPTQSVSFEIMILNGSIAKAFTVEISDAKTGKILLTTKVTSLRKELLNITGIEKDTDLYINAIDSAYNQAIPQEVFIKVGAISLTVSPEPAKVIDLASIFAFPIRYTVSNKIPNSKAEFILKIDGREFVKSSDLEGTSHFFNYSIKDLLSNPVHGVNAKSGQKITFEAFATTTLNDIVIKSNVSIFSVTVVESDTLVIVTDEIGETKENSTSFAQGSNIQFGYYLSYAPNTYSRFTIEHETFLMDANDEVIERVSKGTVEVTKGVNNVYTEGTVGMEITNPGEYLKIVLFARASAGLEDLGAQYEKIVYATIRESGHTIMTAYNDGSLMGYYSNLSGFPNASTTSWDYKWHDTGLFRYNGPFKGLEAFSDNQLSLHLGKTNGITTGFINTGNVDNIINTIVLNGESYAYLDKGRYLFPNTAIGTGIFQNEGFNLSMTYKASRMSDASVVIMSIGDYRDDKLYSGIEITAEKVELRVGNADRIEVKLPINELITVDFDFSLIAPEIGWYFKIYLNGVLSAVTKIESSQID